MEPKFIVAVDNSSGHDYSCITVRCYACGKIVRCELIEPSSAYSFPIAECPDCLARKAEYCYLKKEYANAGECEK